MLNYILGKKIAYYVKAHRGLVICALVLAAVSSLFVLIPTYLLQPFIDEGMKAGSEPVTWKIPWIAFKIGPGFSWHRTDLVLMQGVPPNHLLVFLTVIAFLSILLKSITLYFSELAAAAFSQRAVRTLRIDLFEKFVSLPLQFYNKQKAGELVSRCTADLTVMQTHISGILIGLVQNPLTAFVFLIFLFFMNYRLTLLVFIVVPLIVGLIRLFGRKVKKHSIKVQETLSEVTSAYQENLLCLKVVQGFCADEKEKEKFRLLTDQLYKTVMRYSRWFLGLGPLMDSTVFLVLPTVLIAGKIYFHHTLGEILSMLYAFSRVYAPIKSLARVSTELRTLQGATERVFAIMDTVSDIRNRPKAVVLPRHHRSLEFNNVSFSYEPGVPILKNVSFKIKAGEMLAFVGSTGAGKSTLLDLIPRFYDVTDGSITIDGVDIRDVTLESLRRQVGTVSQEVLLFHDTITNNINFATPEKGLPEIIEAAKAAHAHDFIMNLPHGYGSVVGDRGTLLSGGQRQRIAIARAILSGPAILILDEAASALDAESEKKVQEAIDDLRGGITIIVVAHRLSTIKKADRIYVLENGEILESGSREELMGLNGRFRQLHDMQFRP
jgi:subfamily B ATP-binding cassette protein MsbA